MTTLKEILPPALYECTLREGIKYHMQNNPNKSKNAAEIYVQTRLAENYPKESSYRLAQGWARCFSWGNATRLLPLSSPNESIQLWQHVYNAIGFNCKGVGIYQHIDNTLSLEQGTFESYLVEYLGGQKEISITLVL
jgi:hypothetical protein